jgi:hypothetical protein
MVRAEGPVILLLLAQILPLLLQALGHQVTRQQDFLSETAADFHAIKFK